MKIRRVFWPLIALFCIALTLSSCSSIAEKVSEKAIETALESETGEEVDFDFSDGQINIKTDEGGLSFNVDEENESGSLVITDAEGNKTVAETQDGKTTITDSEGKTILNAESDSEDGVVTITGEDGEKVVVHSEEDSLTIESDDGTYAFDSSGALPKNFPTHIKFANGMQVVSAQASQVNDTDHVFLILLTATGDAASLSTQAQQLLADNGFTQQGEIIESTNGDFYGGFSDGKWEVLFIAASDGSEVNHSYTVQTARN